MLDPTRYMKWNGNAGEVKGQDNSVAKDMLQELEAGVTEIIEEGEESEEESDEEEEERKSALSPQKKTSVGDDMLISDVDLLQTFTHYTYRISNRQVMICDLQGVLETSVSPPVFELTDPVIHFSSTSGKKSQIWSH